MNQFIEFMINNWQFIVAVGLGIIELILMLVFKRRPQLNFKGLLLSILTWIGEAEAKFTVGSDKMSYVLAQAKIYLGDSYNENSLRAIVEYVLSLPEKKKEKK